MISTVTLNQLLGSVALDHRTRIVDGCRPAVLQAGSVLAHAGSATDDVFFIETGFLSVIVSGGDLAEVEVGVVGREGMSGSWLALGHGAAPFRMVAQVPGMALRMDHAAFQDACQNYPEFRHAVLAFCQTLTGMLAETCRANARLTVEGRLARWLLMAHERANSDHLAITHETLSNLLGVRRPGITGALHVLEGEHMIKATRKMIRILDRQKLETVSRGTSGPAPASSRAPKRQAATT